MEVFGNSVGEILAGFIEGDVEAHDNAVVNISGGLIQGFAQTEAGGTVNVFDGSVGAGVQAGENGAINILGGSLDSDALAYSNGQLYISAGLVGGDVFAVENSHVEISGGLVLDDVAAFDSGSIDILGGTLNEDIVADDDSRVLVAGGIIGPDDAPDERLEAYDNGIITVVGSNFQVDGVDVGLGPISELSGLLSGTLSDGKFFDMAFVQEFPDQITLSDSLFEPTPGDYDGDGDVDREDYDTWRQAFGTVGQRLGADGNGDAAVNAADYTVWRDHLGATSSASLTTVPEPSAITLMTCAALSIATGLRRHPSVRFFIAGLLAGPLCTFGSFAQAEAIYVSNAGFEEPVLADHTWQDWNSSSELYSGWRFIDSHMPRGIGSLGVAVWNPLQAAYPGDVPEGSNVLSLWSWYDEGDGAIGVGHTLEATLQPLTRYSLQVEVGNTADFYDPTCPSCRFLGFPGYRIELLAGNSVLAADNNTLLPMEGSFATSVVSFVSPSTHAQLGEPLEIRMFSLLSGYQFGTRGTGDGQFNFPSSRKLRKPR